MKNTLITTVLIFIFLVARSQQSYYVATNGNDNSNGTSVVTAWKTIQHAFDNATPGSKVFIRQGIYKNQLSINVSGTVGNPIEFRNYQNEEVIIEGYGLSSLGGPMIDIYNQSNIIIRNLIIENLLGLDAVGIQVDCSPTGHVENLTFKNITVRGFAWTENPDAIPNSSTNAQPFVAYGEGSTAANAIKNIVVDSCEFYYNQTGYSESLTLDGNIDGFTISNNKVHDNTNIGILCAGNYQVSNTASVDMARNGKVFGNICSYNYSLYATSGGIYVDGGKDIVIEKNSCFQNGWGIEIGCEENGSSSNITVRENLLYDNVESGLAIGGYDVGTTGQVLNCAVYNNIFFRNNFSNSGSGELYITKASNNVIKSNIFYTNDLNTFLTREAITPQAGNTIDYNCWFTPNNNSAAINVNWGTSTLTGFQQYKSASGYDTHSLYVNPLFVNASISSPNFHLQQLSTLIDAANRELITVANGETDYAGNARIVGMVDIGAYEFPDAINRYCSNNVGGAIYTSNLTGSIYQWQINSGNGFTNLGNSTTYAGTTLKTLGITGIQSSFNGNQYRCLVDGSNYSNIFTISFVNYWVGAVSTEWEDPANWSCNKVPDAYTDVVMLTNKPAVLNSNTAIRSFNLGLKSNFSINGSFKLIVNH